MRRLKALPWILVLVGCGIAAGQWWPPLPWGNLGVQTGGYINWGGGPTGTNGYGIRSNAGSIEFKNLGGAWTAIGSVYTDAMARLALSSTMTGLTYTNTTGVFSATAGYAIPANLDDIVNGVSVAGAGGHAITITHDGTDGYINSDVGDLILQKTGGAAATVLDLSDGSANYLSLTTAAMAADYTWTFPATGGTANYLLKTNGSGGTDWTNAPTLDSITLAKNIYATYTDDGNSGAADTIDFSASRVHKSTMTGDCTYTFTAPPSPCWLQLSLYGDGTARTITWPAAVKWPAGTKPTHAGTNGAIDVISMFWDGSVYQATFVLDIR